MLQCYLSLLVMMPYDSFNQPSATLHVFLSKKQEHTNPR